MLHHAELRLERRRWLFRLARLALNRLRALFWRLRPNLLLCLANPRNHPFDVLVERLYLRHLDRWRVSDHLPRVSVDLMDVLVHVLRFHLEPFNRSL